MKPERVEIIRKLMHKPTMSFNELWEKKGPSNAFAYHLKILEEDHVVKKTPKGYQLTHEGKRLSGYIEGSNGEKAEFPIPAVLIIIFNKKEDKILMMHRKKEPFYGYWGFIGGKLHFTQYILECAAQEVKEETGLSCDLELKGMTTSKTYNNESLSYNHLLFVVKGTNPQGTLIKKTREGSNEWVDINNLPEPRFPNVPNSIKTAQSKHYRWIEADRFQEDDKFVKMNILKDKEI